MKAQTLGALNKNVSSGLLGRPRLLRCGLIAAADFKKKLLLQVVSVNLDVDASMLADEAARVNVSISLCVRSRQTRCRRGRV